MSAVSCADGEFGIRGCGPETGSPRVSVLLVVVACESLWLRPKRGCCENGSEVPAEGRLIAMTSRLDLGDMRIDENRDSWGRLARSLVFPAYEFWQAMPTSGIWHVSSHGRQADIMEAFARTSLLGACAVTVAEPAELDRLHSCFSYGVTAGLLEGSGDRSWPSPAENRHALVEAASVATSLWLNDGHLWSILDQRQQEAVAAWLGECAHQSSRMDNNWVLFGHTVAAFLESVGRADAAVARIAPDIEDRCESWYAGDGWYSDGGQRTFDYYNSYAFHYYLPLVAWLQGDHERTELYRSRLKSYLGHLGWLIDSRGAPVYFGRSLTYRFGVIAPLSLAGVVSPEPPSDAMALSTRVVNYFISNGAVGGDGIVHRGWHGTEPAAVQKYSGPLGSYWFAKAFVNLLSPVDSPYWQGSGDYRVGDDTGKHRMGSTGLLAVAEKPDLTVLVNHGSYNRTSIDLGGLPEDPLYCRLEYSTRTRPVSGAHSLSNGLSIDLGPVRFTRARPLEVGTEGPVLRSRWVLRAELPRWESKAHVAVSLVAKLRKLTRYGRRFEQWLGPVLEVQSKSLDGWIVHAFRLPRQWLPIGVVRFGGWPLEDATLVRGFDEKMVCLEQQKLRSVILPIAGWKSHGVDEDRTRGSSARYPYVEGRARRGQWYVVADSLETAPDELAAPDFCWSESRESLLLSFGDREVLFQLDTKSALSGSIFVRSKRLIIRWFGRMDKLWKR